MTRKALLIGSPGGLYSDYLRGVRVDLRSMKEFLMSPQGGAWYEDEIIVLDDPNMYLLSEILKLMDAEYTITMFSGHGFADQYKNRFLSLTSGDYFQDTDLLNESPRQLVLVDACRNVFYPGISGLPFGDPEFHFDGGYSDLQRARKIYDKWIELSPPGRLILHSTSHGISASDTPEGGVFTNKLLQVGRSVPVKDKFHFYNILKTGNFVPKMIREDGYLQKPCIVYRRGNIELPFALSIPKTRTITKKSVPKKEPNYAGALLGIGLLAVILGSID